MARYTIIEIEMAGHWPLPPRSFNRILKLLWRERNNILRIGIRFLNV
jgi:hypothetical protein